MSPFYLFRNSSRLRNWLATTVQVARSEAERAGSEADSPTWSRTAAAAASAVYLARTLFRGAEQGFGFGRLQRTRERGTREVIEASRRIGGCRHGAFRQPTRRFDPLRIIHRDECLQGGVGPRAPRADHLTGGGVEGLETGRWRGTLPEGVHAAAVEPSPLSGT